MDQSEAKRKEVIKSKLTTKATVIGAVVLLLFVAVIDSDIYTYTWTPSWNQDGSAGYKYNQTISNFTSGGTTYNGGWLGYTQSGSLNVPANMTLNNSGAPATISGSGCPSCGTRKVIP